MDLQQLVKAFNSLPRSPKTPSGTIDNHWQFTVHHINFPPPEDLLHVVNPGSRFTLTSRHALILHSTSADIQADIVLPLLLGLFVAPSDPSASLFAPWSWGTANKELAKALEKKMKSAGVREELCKVDVGDEEKIKIEQEVWTEFVGILARLVRSRCSECGSEPEPHSEPLQLCARCKSARYCSRDCQRENWKAHKLACKMLADSTTAVSTYEYYQKIAPQMPEAQVLATEIGLDFSTPSGLNKPMRRLVVTGKDSLENMRILFGPNEKEIIDDLHKEKRIEALLQPPKGSPMYALTVSDHADENCPPWALRKASAEEEREIEEVRSMQRLIRQHMGPRGVHSISPKDMKDILQQNFPDSWVEWLPRYQTAVNALDQGVRIP